ncbi:flagellar biosynthetic protein FliO [Aurantiacibacter luteus]|uniref:Flagellar biogenesis protein n=1 Tax=Aurantiacibacter luteus TaxID=1581420 RepID=A0A0G9MKQ8_9SPHN|nr:flagellar biosynthetic protein FliO [Aurantiacibacter luteus]KLE31270.1 flagellar biogenesis protein [Aurantiacibacter luteus]
MVWYVVKLVLMLPLIGLLIWGSLVLTRKLQARVGPAQRTKAARLVETTFLAPGVKLAVIEFHGREILVGSSRHGLVRLAEAGAVDRSMPENGE